MENCADSIKVTRSLFQVREGGAVPTSAHNFELSGNSREFELSCISRQLAKACYRQWHYLGDMGFISTHNFGVFLESKLLGCISYGSPNATELKGYFDRFSQKGWWEIKRLALSDELPKNSESKSIGISLRLLRKMETVKGVVTYADTKVGHVGTIYKASGFEYKGLTAPKKDFWVNGKIQQRGKTKGVDGTWKTRSQKHLFIKQWI